jgi:glycosyltransferase involved in cell wall biosynthesis
VPPADTNGLHLEPPLVVASSLTVSRLSIVVPVFNEAEVLPTALPRLLNAPCPIERDLIVVDDGSTDASAEFVREFAATGSGRRT